MEPDKDNKMLNMAEAAKQLGYQPSGLYEIVKRTKRGKPGPQIQFFQIGTGPIKFRKEWLDDFVLANSVESGQIAPVQKPKRSRKSTPHKTQIEPHWSMAV